MLDQYKIEHEKALKELKECNNRVKDSCMPCEHYIKCPLRLEYVTKTFQFLAKGKTGGFEF